MRYVTNGKGELVVISRSGEIVITDPHGRERERHKVPYGALLNVKSDQQIKAGTVLATWDPLTRPIITEFAGKAKFENVEEGVTVAKQLDEVTGLSTLVVIDPKRRGAAKVVRPQVKLLDVAGNEVKIPGTDHSVTIGFPVGSLIQIRDGQDLTPGEVLARIPVEGQKTRDITGGLPRVAELFEARTPKDKGTLAEMTGTVSFGKETKGKVRLQITDPEGKVYEELVPKEKNIVVHEGQVVNKGESIVDGPADPQDILRLLGIEELARYIVDEVQDVYRLQGVKINDKHIEVIVRQMLRRVQIANPGDTSYIVGEQVERSELLDTQRQGCCAEGKMPATHADVLLGITKASLSTDSFISAASFQETTRVLTEAAIMGKRDELRGLKENVIVGRLIPAGTGMAFHDARKAKEEMDDAERRAIAVQEAEELAVGADGAGRRGHRCGGGERRHRVSRGAAQAATRATGDGRPFFVGGARRQPPPGARSKRPRPRAPLRSPAAPRSARARVATLVQLGQRGAQLGAALAAAEARQRQAAGDRRTRTAPAARRRCSCGSSRSSVRPPSQSPISSSASIASSRSWMWLWLTQPSASSLSPSSRKLPARCTGRSPPARGRREATGPMCPMPCSRQTARPLSASSQRPLPIAAAQRDHGVEPEQLALEALRAQGPHQAQRELGLLLGLVAPVAHQAVGPGDQGARHHLGPRLRRPLRQGDGLVADGDGGADLGQVHARPSHHRTGSPPRGGRSRAGGRAPRTRGTAGAPTACALEGRSRRRGRRAPPPRPPASRLRGRAGARARARAGSRHGGRAETAGCRAGGAGARARAPAPRRRPAARPRRARRGLRRCGR